MDTAKVTTNIETGTQPNSDEIKSNIDRTRERMDRTISELGERLRPANIFSDIVGYIKASPTNDRHSLREDAQKAAQALLHQVQRHPIPSMLLTAGVVWLVVEKRKAAAGPSYIPAEEYESSAMYEADCGCESSEPTTGQQVAEKARQAKDGIVNTLKETSAKAGEKLSSASNSVKSAVGAVKDKLTSATHATVETGRHLKVRTGAVVGKMKEQVQHGYMASKESYRQGVENYPLAMGMGCLALGVICGLLLPRTQREDEFMGDASARLMEKTKAAGKEVLEKTKGVAGDVADKVVDQAKAQGLTATNLVEKVGQVAATAGHTLEERVRQEGTNIKQTAEQKLGGAQASSQPAPASKEPALAGPGCGCGQV